MNATFSYTQSIGLLERLSFEPLLPADQAGLDRVTTLLSLLGDPHLSFRSVHTAGSSGKGSTAAMIGSILGESGFKTGVFRSPHLQSYTERIAVDHRDIDAANWESCFDSIWPIVERMTCNDLTDYHLGRPALFEVLFAMMALHFARSNVEWASIETGLGGRLDATNTLHSEVAVVTNISLEHTQVLGNTLAAIAQEKAAIIKSGCAAVTAVTHEQPLEIILARALAVGAHLYKVGTDIRVTGRVTENFGQALQVTTPSWSISARIPLLGEFQATNAATAVGAALALRDRSVPISDQSIRTGLEHSRVPGRLEVVGRSPLMLLDGAHNPDAALHLALSLKELCGERHVVLVFGALSDKNSADMASALCPVAGEVIITGVPGTNRTASPHAVAKEFVRLGATTTVRENPKEAIDEAIKSAGSDGVVVITGSMYLVGYARTAMNV